MPAAGAYDPSPLYPCSGGEVRTGWESLCAGLPGHDTVVAVDGPEILEWEALTGCLRDALAARGVRVELLDARRHMVDADEIAKRTAPVEDLRDDPDFATLPTGTLADLFDVLPARPDSQGVTLVYGPGAGLIEHDVLWYADVPKRYAEAAVVEGGGRNLGGRPGEATTRRLFYVDWPLLDRHRDAMASRIDRWIDLQRPDSPRWVGGETLRHTLRDLAGKPFRTRPTFNTTSWGGHWAQESLGVNKDARNTALGYELIAPESGILLGAREDAAVEVPFQLMVALQPLEVMGQQAHEQFGSSFPIRFDYLDTVAGGNLSVHCHPREDIMRDVFGWPYTQHETYYMMVGGDESVVYLGLREDADVEAFHERAHLADRHGEPFDIEQFIQTFPADPHQLFLIPAGTPHGSGVGNVVLEVSATPYLYSLRFYDWLRRDADGNQRAVHVDHAFRNLDRSRGGEHARQSLVQQPRTVASGAGWHEEVIGALPEMFFVVTRLVLQPGAEAPQQTDDRFHVLNVVEGEGAIIGTESGEHSLAYAETLLVPAAVGSYSVEAVGDSPVRIVRAFVR